MEEIMISMNNWATQAIEKLDKGGKGISDRRGSIMAPAVAAQLKVFCRQDAEFAQAVVQGGSFADCMKKVASGVGNSISDLDAYKKAVQFYFPGAEVGMKLTLDLIGKAAEDHEEEAEPVSVPLRIHKEYEMPSLNLADFFG